MNQTVAKKRASSARTVDLARTLHAISLVIPVYQGESTLEPLIEEIASLTTKQESPRGNLFHVIEVLLVNDGAVDNSPHVMRNLAKTHNFVRCLWLSRNFGQHAATLAGIANSKSEWILTLDEDGQHDPQDLGKLLDEAIEKKTYLVYAQPSNGLPHDLLRNSMSRLAKWSFSVLLGNRHLGKFNSFRLIHGEVARKLAFYCGDRVFLDGALSWVAENPAYCPVKLRRDIKRKSGYAYHKLFDHFIRLLLTSRRPPLRVVFFLGVGSILLSVLMAAYALWEKLNNRVPVQGWTSLFISISFFSGLILFSLGVLAEYIGILLAQSDGKTTLFGCRRSPKRKKW